MVQTYQAGSPQTQTFTYDGLDRLATGQATGGSGGTYSLQNYTYSSSTGNLSSKAGVNYTYGDTNHKHAVTAMGSDNYTYDADGNQLTRNVGGSSYSLSYDAENRLVGVSGAVTATFVYDGDGNRVKATIGTSTTIYIGNYLEWISSTSDMKKYYYAGSTRVAMRSDTLKFLLGDHLGSTSITTDSNGVYQTEVRYYAWGGQRWSSGTLPTTFQYTGQRQEDYIKLYWYGSRWYDSALGRFIQPDSIIPEQNDSQSWDRYCYTSNNPVKYTDPSGHCPWCLVGALIGAAAGYDIQVYNNYQNGYTGTDAWTQNISAKPIIGGAILGAGAIILAPVTVAAAGDILVGTGVATSTAGLVLAGNAANEASQTIANAIYPVSYPVLEIDSSIMPNIANNIQTAQANGSPSILTRMEDQAAIRANRAAAIAGFTGTGSPDEYPFASTYEGGVGAYVNGVPMEEQWVQGGVISQFYQNNNLVDGSRFRVLVK